MLYLSQHSFPRTYSDSHGESVKVVATDQNLIFGIISAFPLVPSLDQGLTLLRDRTRDSLKLQREFVVINRSIGKSNIVFAVVASGVLFRRVSVGPAVP